MASEVDPSKSENQSNLSNLEHIQEIQYYEGQTYFPAASHSSPSISMSGLWRVKFIKNWRSYILLATPGQWKNCDIYQHKAFNYRSNKEWVRNHLWTRAHSWKWKMNPDLIETSAVRSKTLLSFTSPPVTYLMRVFFFTVIHSFRWTKNDFMGKYVTKKQSQSYNYLFKNT